MSKSIDRRQFLGTTAISGVAVGLHVAKNARAANSANDKVVVGVMGLQRGRSLADSFAKQTGVEIKYVCDVDSNRADSCAKLIEGTGAKRPQTIGDFRRLLDDDSVDALVCAAPNHWHAPATIMACSAGKHVYVEKPCCHNPREGELMVQAARTHKRAVQMGSQRRSGPTTIRAMQELHEGVIGRVYLVRAYYNSARESIGKGQRASVPDWFDYELWQGPAPRVPYKEYILRGERSPHYNWHWLWHWGNGELGNNGVHTLDLCRWGLGVDYPIRVTSSGGRYHHVDDQQTPDTHTVCFEFEGKRTITWQGLSCNRHRGGFVTYYGDKGTLELDSDGTYIIYDAGDKQVRKETGKTRGDIEHIDNFLTAIREEKPLALNAEIEKGHKSTLLCHLGNIAQRTGRTLNCRPKDGHIIGDDKAMALWSRDYESGWEPKV